MDEDKNKPARSWGGQAREDFESSPVIYIVSIIFGLLLIYALITH